LKGAVSKQAEFHRARAAKMRDRAKEAPSTTLRKIFEDIAAEYDKLASAKRRSCDK
jgi:hypothetical protein